MLSSLEAATDVNDSSATVVEVMLCTQDTRRRLHPLSPHKGFDDGTDTDRDFRHYYR